MTQEKVTMSGFSKREEQKAIKTYSEIEKKYTNIKNTMLFL